MRDFTHINTPSVLSVPQTMTVFVFKRLIMKKKNPSDFPIPVQKVKSIKVLIKYCFFLD